MILNTTDRARFFNAARAVSPELGDLFQNEMNITTEMLEAEIQHMRDLLHKQEARFEAYRQVLDTLYWFPETFEP